MKILNQNPYSKEEVITLQLSLSDLEAMANIQGIGGSFNNYRTTEDHQKYHSKIITGFTEYIEKDHKRLLSYKKVLDSIDEFKEKLEFLHKKGA